MTNPKIASSRKSLSRSYFALLVCLSLAACTSKPSWSVHSESAEQSFKQGYFHVAEEEYQRALADASKENAPPLEQAKIMNSLAKTYLRQRDKYMQAEELCLKSLDIRRKTNGENDLSYVDSLITLARDYYLQKKYGYDDGHVGDFAGKGEKAAEFFQKAKGISSKLGAKGQLAVAESDLGLGKLYADDYSNKGKAKGLVEESVKIRQRVLGGDSPLLAEALVDKAFVLIATAEYPASDAIKSEAEASARRALEIQKKSLGDHPDMIATYDQLGTIYQMQHRYPQAGECYKQALGIEKKFSGSALASAADDPDDKSLPLQHLIRLYSDLDQAALLKPFSANGFDYVPVVSNDSPKGFKLKKGSDVILDRQLSKEYPYEYANISLVFPLAKARLKKNFDQLDARWGETNILTGDRLARLPAVNELLDGKPSLIVGTFSGGMNSCCTDYELISLDGKAKKLPGLENLNAYGFTFGDFRGDGTLMAIGHDTTFAYWNASMADSSVPQVVLKYTPAGWILSADDMKAGKIPQAAIDHALARCREAMKPVNKDYEIPAEVFELNSSIVSTVLNLIYLGHANDAWAFLDKLWPADKPLANETDDKGNYLTKEQYIQSMKEQLHKSPYWKELAEMNAGQAI